jgi:hypothetical protein
MAFSIRIHPDYMDTVLAGKPDRIKRQAEYRLQQALRSHTAFNESYPSAEAADAAANTLSAFLNIPIAVVGAEHS